MPNTPPPAWSQTMWVEWLAPRVEWWILFLGLVFEIVAELFWQTG